MPKYKVTFVSRHIEEFEVEAATESEARDKVYTGEVEPVWVVEVADGVTAVEEIVR